MAKKRAKTRNVPCDECVQGLCWPAITAFVRDGKNKALPAGVEASSKPATIREMFARIPKTGAAAKDFYCRVVDGRRCRDGRSGAKPHYDEKRRSLYFRKRILCHYIRAGNRVTVLNAFQKQRWPPRVDDPLGSDHQTENKLRDTVYWLNRDQDEIHFFSDGTGCGICWEPVG
jgi:hypothetical protein